MKNLKICAVCITITVLTISSIVSAFKVDGLLDNIVNFDAAPMWTQPCLPGDPKSDPSLQNVNLDKNRTAFSFERIQSQAETALRRANEWKSEWTEYVVLKPYDEVIADLPKNNSPEYLPNEVENPNPTVTLNERDTLFQNTQENLKKVAVGMEQMVYDQYNNGDKFARRFREIYMDLKVLLCEIYVVMFQLAIPEKFPDVYRDLMPKTERETKEHDSKLDTRNFYIFRQYINMMSYTVKVMKGLASLSKQ